jgi:hypothetical protein
MARYVPQHLFDGLVIYRLMADLAGKDDIFDELIARYRDSYPDDDTNSLVADVNAAASAAREILKAVPATSQRHEMALLLGVLEVFKEDATRDKSLWRKMFENYFFNVQPTPIPDRVEKARAHFAAAQKVLATLDLQALPE